MKNYSIIIVSVRIYNDKKNEITNMPKLTSEQLARYGLDEKDFRALQDDERPDLKLKTSCSSPQRSKTDNDTLFEIIKRPFFAEDGKYWMLTPSGAKKFIASFDSLEKAIFLLPSAAHAGNKAFAEALAEKLTSNNKIKFKDVVVSLIVALIQMENFTGKYFPDELREKLLTTIKMPEFFTALLNGIYDFKGTPLLKILLVNAHLDKNETAILLLEYLITQAILQKKLRDFMDMDSDEEHGETDGRSLLTNLLANARSESQGHEVSLALLKQVIKEAASHKQLAELMLIEPSRSRKGVSLLKSLAANVCSDSRGHDISLLLLHHTMIEAASHQQLVKLMTMAFDKDGWSLLTDLLANARNGSQNHEISLELLKHAIKEAALHGQLIELMTIELIDRKGDSLLKNLIANVCSDSRGHDISLALLHDIIQKAVLHKQFIQLMAMDTNGKNCSFLRNLIVNARVDGKGHKNACLLLRYIIEEAALHRHLAKFISMNSNREGWSLLKNLMANAFSQSRGYEVSFLLLQDIITEAAFRNPDQLLDTMQVVLDESNKSLLLHLFIRACLARRHSPQAMDLLKLAITQAAKNKLLIKFMCLYSNSRFGRTAFIQDLCFRISHQTGNDYAKELLLHAINEAASNGCLLELLKMEFSLYRRKMSLSKFLREMATEKMNGAEKAILDCVKEKLTQKEAAELRLVKVSCHKVTDRQSAFGDGSLFTKKDSSLHHKREHEYKHDDCDVRKACTKAQRGEDKDDRNGSEMRTECQSDFFSHRSYWDDARREMSPASKRKEMESDVTPVQKVKKPRI